MSPIHRIDEKTLYNSFKNNGLRMLDFLVYFSHPIVRRNFGIENVKREDDHIIFEVSDEKKFFLKCIKYGI
jgi:hypothetical protein